jgi:hypothetical protein
MKNFEIPVTLIVNASTAQEALDQLGNELDYLCKLDNQICSVHYPPVTKVKQEKEIDNEEQDDEEQERFIDRSVDCYKCNALVDEREVMPNESKYGGDDNGGYLCKACVSFYP